MNKVKNAVRGFKVFNSDWTCRDYQFKVGEIFVHDEDIRLCGKGFHFCREIADCFNYYSFNPTNKVAEVEALGDVLHGDDKSVTNELHIVREVSWEEMLNLANTGKGNTGLSNSGNRNSGNRNSGDWNSGYRNSGYRNSGDRNSGDWNSGYRNSGDRNSGYRNSGNRNSGDRNSGDWNSGNWNSGDWNSGDWNSGDWNSGNWNSGNWNSGNRNSGNRNSGDRNSGDWNLSNGNAGCFNTEEHTIMMFDKPSSITLAQWYEHRGRAILNAFNYSPVQWISEYNMTDKEKAEHPTYKTTEGYLKRNPQTHAEAFQEYWNDLSTTDKADVLSIPNFDAVKFQKITGVDVHR